MTPEIQNCIQKERAWPTLAYLASLVRLAILAVTFFKVHLRQLQQGRKLFFGGGTENCHKWMEAGESANHVRVWPVMQLGL